MFILPVYLHSMFSPMDQTQNVGNTRSVDAAEGSGLDLVVMTMEVDSTKGIEDLVIIARAEVSVEVLVFTVEDNFLGHCS